MLAFLGRLSPFLSRAPLDCRERCAAAPSILRPHGSWSREQTAGRACPLSNASQGLRLGAEAEKPGWPNCFTVIISRASNRRAPSPKQAENKKRTRAGLGEQAAWVHNELLAGGSSSLPLSVGIHCHVTKGQCLRRSLLGSQAFGPRLPEALYIAQVFSSGWPRSTVAASELSSLSPSNRGSIAILHPEE